MCFYLNIFNFYVSFFRYLDPIFFGEYPASMQASVGSNLPTFTKEQVALIKGSQDFVGINHYTSMYATYNDSNGEVIKTGMCLKKKKIATNYILQEVFIAQYI